MPILTPEVIPVGPWPPLTATPAVTDMDAEDVRQIRNSCAAYMTGDNRELSPERQRAWWHGPERHRNAIWLYSTPRGEAVGYGLIRMVEGRWYATLGLLPAWRGRGYGVDIYRHLVAACPGDLHVDVLLTNSRSARAAERAGFRLLAWTGVYATLVARKGER